MISNQSLGCIKGDNAVFEIDMTTDAGPVDLTGASAEWILAESWFDGAQIFLVKTTALGGGILILNDAGVWKLIIQLAPDDTLSIGSGTLFHECRVTLSDDSVTHIASGTFILEPSLKAVTRNIHGTQIVGSIGQAATGAHIADWFVDSVAGSDSNNGTSQGTSFATLAAIASAVGSNPTRTKIAAKRGSLFRESLSPSVTSIADYGNLTDPLPIIDGSNIVTGWTVNATQSAVWEKSLTIDTGGRPRIYEDGLLMPHVDDLATCAATPGSRVLLNDGGSVTLQMHPTGSGNPNANGRVYEATIRSSVINMVDNCSVAGIHARRALHNNGAIQMGRNARIERCISSDGSKHNILVNSGSLIDTIAVRADEVTAAEPSNVLIVGFDPGGIAGESLSLTRVGFVTDGGSPSSPSFFAHDSVGGAYDSVTAEQVWLVQSGIFSPVAASVSVQGYYAEQCQIPLGGWYSSQISVDCFQTRNTGWNSDTGVKDITAISNLSPQTIILSNGAFYSDGSNDAQLRVGSGMNGAGFTIQNVAFANSVGSDRKILADLGWTTGSITISRTIMQSNPEGTVINIPTGISYTGNYNVFARQDGAGPGTEALTYHGTVYQGLPAWKSATAQDANSIEFEGQLVAQLFSGNYTSGDYRLAGAGIGASAAAINAGPQYHWNWNTRAKVAGSPTAWPTVPKTLADAIAYVKNPSAWSW